MPIRLGGFGLRLASQLAHAAFWSSLAQSAVDIVQLIPQAKRTELLVNKESQIPLARQLENSLRDIRSFGMPSGDNTVIPQSMQQFWNLYGAERPARGLQRALTSYRLNTAFDRFVQDPLTDIKDVQRSMSSSSPECRSLAFMHSLMFRTHNARP